MNVLYTDLLKLLDAAEAKAERSGSVNGVSQSEIRYIKEVVIGAMGHVAPTKVH